MLQQDLLVNFILQRTFTGDENVLFKQINGHIHKKSFDNVTVLQ